MPDRRPHLEPRTALLAAVALFAVQGDSYLPESCSASELFRFDLDLYVRFVLALAGTDTVAAGPPDGAR